MLDAGDRASVVLPVVERDDVLVPLEFLEVGIDRFPLVMVALNEGNIGRGNEQRRSSADGILGEFHFLPL